MGFVDQLLPKKYTMQPFVQKIDGNTVVGYLFTPKKGYNGRLIIDCHGGFSLAKQNDVESYTDVTWYCGECGFAVFVLKYDKDSIQGMKEATLKRDVVEAYDAARIFKKRFPNAKIYLLGASRGSWVAQWTMIAYPEMFQAGAYLVGPTYLPSFFANVREKKIFPEVTVGERIGLDLIHPYFCWHDGDEENSSSNLFPYCSTDSSFQNCLNSKPMLLIYGLQDPTVPWQQGQMLADACGLTRGKEFYILNYNHGLGRELEAMKLVRDFFFRI